MGRVPGDDFIYELISKEIERLSKDLNKVGEKVKTDL